MIHNSHFKLLIFNQKEDEVWLEKSEKGFTTVIRLTTRSFDWKNHLKADVARVFQQVKMMRKILRGKHIQIYNLYVTSLTPIDDWSEFRRPLRTNERNSPEMHLSFLTEDTFTEELEKLGRLIEFTPVSIPNLEDEQDYAEAVKEDKRFLIYTYEKQQKELKNIFSAGTPRLTFILLVTNIIMFYLLEINGGSTNIKHLIEYGANYSPAVMDGEWWRMVSSMFLHIGFFHLLMNMIALYYLGMAVERMFGTKRFAFIYFLSGIGASVASFSFTQSVSAGASGAIFGLFGSLLFFGLNHKRLFSQTMGKNIIIVIGINVLIGVFVPQIDQAAHLGGLVFGFIASIIVQMPKKKQVLHQVGASLLYLVLIASLVTYGYQANLTNNVVHLSKIEDRIAEEDYEEVIDLANEALAQSTHYNKEILFNRSYAYIELNKWDEAIADLEEVIEIDDQFAEAHYNLALVYLETGETEEARDRVEQAYKLKPEDSLIEDLYEQLFE